MKTNANYEKVAKVLCSPPVQNRIEELLRWQIDNGYLGTGDGIRAQAHIRCVLPNTLTDERVLEIFNTLLEKRK
jgi:hypothetical protein